ncbi:MAG: hypothetical protein LBC31_00350 [Treponema sp.]|nr:hypothetical protein [Treponema sp.]
MSFVEEAHPRKLLERLRKVLEAGKGMPKGSPLSAYINMVLRANPEGLQEVMKMSDAALEAVFEEEDRPGQSVDKPGYSVDRPGYPEDRTGQSVDGPGRICKESA